MDSPDSPLSDVHSDDFEEELPPSARTPSVSPEFEEPASRPSKRQRTSGATKAASRRSNAANTASSNITAFDAHEEAGSTINIPSDEDISSDTEGSVPGSPHLGPTTAEDEDVLGGKEQVSICKWDGCPAGDQKNMDLLVKHLHDEHIHARQKKYSCEWMDCPRKGIAHASGYALRAHMRSHTREKPFYCNLPECDRSFTRSDALAKHMRTVHETEALRPSDPVPKHHSSNPQNRSQRLRLTFNKLSGNSKTDDDMNSPGSSKGVKDGPISPSFPPQPTLLTPADIEYEQNNPTFTRDPTTGDWVARFPPDITFSPKEIALVPAQLMVLLHRQIQWATDAGEELKTKMLQLERERKSEWIAKEVVLNEYIKREQAIAIAEEEAEEAERLANLTVEDDGTIVESKEGVENDEYGVAGGEIPPYPYAVPDDHERSTVNEVA